MRSGASALEPIDRWRGPRTCRTATSVALSLFSEFENSRHWSSPVVVAVDGAFLDDALPRRIRGSTNRVRSGFTTMVYHVSVRPGGHGPGLVVSSSAGRLS